ncbi:CaiB/BaiF CoA transferase family protein [Chloroflexota bacterium]
MNNEDSSCCLSPYRVIDLTGETGLICGKMLADLGADVIKVEPPGGDPARQIGPYYHNIPHPERSLLWWAFNTNKRSVTLDIERKSDRERLKALINTGHFVLESFPPGYLDNLGLGYDGLVEINPSIILTSITPFGWDGPYRDFIASDIVLMALGGQMYPCGDPDRPPVRIGLAQAYLHAGVHAAIGSLLAHHHRQRTGEGQHVDVSIQEAVARLQFYDPFFWYYDRLLIRREGARIFRGGYHVRQLYPCRDGFIAFRLLGARYARNIRGLVEWMAEEGLAGELTNLNWQDLDMSKLENVDAVEATFGAFFLRYSKRELQKEAAERHFLLQPVNSALDILDDKQLQARGYWSEVAHPELSKTFFYPGAPYRLSETPWKIRRRAPLIGEDNEEVFDQLNSALRESTSLAESLVAELNPGKGKKRLPLEGIKVLDFMWALAGAAATSYLADFGAEVIHIESDIAPDIMRVTPPYKNGVPGRNRAFGSVLGLSGKKSLALNLSTSKGQEIARRLVGWADIVAENFAPGVVKRWGLSYDDLKGIHPDIIMVSSSAYGQTGPRCDEAGLGPQLSAFADFEYLTGWADRGPVICHPGYTDTVAPLFLCFVILATLDYRQRTGRGQYIDLSQVESSLHFLSVALMDCVTNGHLWERRGNRSNRAVPHGAYPCKGDDRWCSISVYSEEQWKAFCQAIGNPSWTLRPKFASFGSRKENEDELDKLIAGCTIHHSAEETMELMQQARVPAGVVQSARDLLENDAQLKHRHFFHFRDHAELGKTLHYGWPIKFSKTPQQYRSAPCLGEHTIEICCQYLGMSEEEVAKLIDEGVLA